MINIPILFSKQEEIRKYFHWPWEENKEILQQSNDGDVAIFNKTKMSPIYLSQLGYNNNNILPCSPPPPAKKNDIQFNFHCLDHTSDVMNFLHEHSMWKWHQNWNWPRFVEYPLLTYISYSTSIPYIINIRQVVSTLKTLKKQRISALKHLIIN